MASARASATRCCWPPDSWCGVVPGEASQADRLQQLRAALRPAAAGQPEADVRGHREVREQRALLRHVADAAAFGGQEGAEPVGQGWADPDRARVGALEAGQHPQQGGLAAAGRAEDSGQRARGHVQVQARQHLVTAEGLGQPGDRQLGHVIILRAELSKNRPST
jgi:hypothetical protein